MKQKSIPCMFMRSGTSRGPFFLASDLPSDVALRDKVLLRVMGSPDARQIDGLGGATTVTSKVSIASVSDHVDADIDYLFAQVDIDNELVDTKPTCGNMLAGIGPFAIERGLLPATPGQTRLVVRNVNTDTFIDAVIETPDGEVNYDGDYAIDGVPGTSAPIDLRFRHIEGAVTGKQLPTGEVSQTIEGVEVTCIDVAMPMVIARAEDLGWSGHEKPDEIHGDAAFMERMQAIRHEAGRLMGLGDVSESVVPKFGLVASPREGGHVASRYLTPWQCHPAYAVSGSICLASCALMPGSVAHSVAQPDDRAPATIQIEHPSGALDVSMVVEFGAEHGPGGLRVESGGSMRTVRPIMNGEVFVPSSVWSA